MLHNNNPVRDYSATEDSEDSAEDSEDSADDSDDSVDESVEAEDSEIDEDDVDDSEEEVVSGELQAATETQIKRQAMHAIIFFIVISFPRHSALNKIRLKSMVLIVTLFTQERQLPGKRIFYPHQGHN